MFFLFRIDAESGTYLCAVRVDGELRRRIDSALVAIKSGTVDRTLRTLIVGGEVADTSGDPDGTALGADMDSAVVAHRPRLFAESTYHVPVDMCALMVARHYCWFEILRGDGTTHKSLLFDHDVVAPPMLCSAELFATESLNTGPDETVVDIWSCDGDRVIGQVVARLENGRLPPVVAYAFVSADRRLIAGFACWRHGKFILDRQLPSRVIRWSSATVSSLDAELHAAFVAGQARRDPGAVAEE